MPNPCRVVIIGCGGMGRHHIRQILKQTDTTQIVALCDPAEAQLAKTHAIFAEAGVQPPPNEVNIDALLRDYAPDAAFIVTPHALHYGQAKFCLESGVDVLLEKPMVMNAIEARSLIETQQRTGKLLVVAFPGSLSPQVRKAVAMLRSGEIGKLLSIDAVCWQDWGPGTVDTWRQQPEISGGGFLFDTGAHMLNTVVDLAGEGFAQVAAWLDYNDRPVETTGVVMGQLRSGAMVTLHGCGEAIPSCSSEIRIFCSKAILRTGIWGEKLEIQYAGKDVYEPIPVPPSLGVWEQFLAVRSGQIPNPCPPEVGLRMNILYDTLVASAQEGGRPVRC